MIFSPHDPILRLTVMLCVILSFVLTNQSTIALMDRAQHIVQQEHAPNPLAGRVTHCEHHHDQNGTHHHCSSGHHDNDDPVTHQHLESSMVYIVAVPPSVAAPRQASFVAVAVPQELDRLYAYRLERPPKTDFAKYA